MAINIRIELEDLKHICECLEYCLKDNKIKPSEVQQITTLAEKLRNDYEEYSNLKKEQD